MDVHNNLPLFSYRFALALKQLPRFLLFVMFVIMLVFIAV